MSRVAHEKKKPYFCLYLTSLTIDYEGMCLHIPSLAGGLQADRGCACRYPLPKLHVHMVHWKVAVLSAYHTHKIHSKSESVCLELFVHFEEGHSKMTLHDGLTEYLASLALFGVVLICLPICISLTSLELFNCNGPAVMSSK